MRVVILGVATGKERPWSKWLDASPENVDLFLDASEVFVAGGQGGFAIGG